MDDYKRTVYVDMDGVLADWEQGAVNLVGAENMDKDHIIWSSIHRYGKTKFFSGLPWMPDGEELWSFVTDNFLDVKILSAGRDQKTLQGKSEWLRHNIPSLSSDDIIFVNNKHRKQHYSKPNDIIIDDTPVVIQEWKARGGIGILNTSATDSINELKQYV